MSRRTENEKEFKSVSYWRILRFVRPYWLMLTIGIVAGLTVGGSLFGGLMLIPDIAMIVDQDTGQSTKRQKTAEEVIRAVEEAPDGMNCRPGPSACRGRWSAALTRRSGRSRGRRSPGEAPDRRRWGGACSG